MTRRELLAQYRPIRAAIQDILRVAVGACEQSDFRRAARQLGLLNGTTIELPAAAEDQASDMLSDIALFEPNQRGERAWDRFMAKSADTLPDDRKAIAQRMGNAFFSLFRCADGHEGSGLWLEDLLRDGHRIWIMDEGLEKTAFVGDVFGMRLFDAGPFHAGFGIPVHPDRDEIDLIVSSHKETGRTPFRHSLAATLYADVLREYVLPAGLDEEILLQLLPVIEKLAGQPPKQRPPRKKKGR